MKKFTKIIISATLSLLPIFALNNTLAFAAPLRLELTQGVEAAIPIAILPFQGASSDQPLAPIISSDLNNSGRFQVIDVQKIEQFPQHVREINYSYWRNQKIDYVTIGHVQSLGGEQFLVKFSLIDIFKPQSPVLISQEFTVQRHQLRTLAHHISDKIYQALLGIPGFFSTRIAYISVDHQVANGAQYTLEIADADGYNPRSLLISNQPIMSPAWSPDAKKIAYVIFENKQAKIYSIDVATGQRQLLTAYPGINGAPAWSPDGRKLAMALSKDGNPNIYVLDLATGQLQQITEGLSISTEPSWAPDGRSLVFTSDRGGNPQIYRVQLADRSITRVTFSGNYNARASFSPDGKNLVMLNRAERKFNIAIQNLRTGTVQVLTQQGSTESPSFAPNGSMILYASRIGGRGILEMVSSDARIKLRLPARTGEVQEPAWSPS